MTHRSYRKQSRDNDWGTSSENGFTIEQINCGSLLRIADSVEKMAQRHTELIDERDRFKRWFAQEEDTARCLRRRLSAAKGQITKLKKKATK